MIALHLGQPNKVSFFLLQLVVGVVNVSIRGEVKDIKLAAKAKDTKKIRGQGQGQPFLGQTLSRSSTGMREAKAKDTGASVLRPQKKVFKNFFSGNLQKEKGGLQTNFSGELLKKRCSKIFFRQSTKF